jgi:hypothetical protein
MCLAIPDKRKKQPAVGFPQGWTFYFTNADSVQPTPLARLVLVSPKNLPLRSVDSAINRHKRLLAMSIHTLKRDFYAHIGALPGDEDDSCSVAAAGQLEGNGSPAKKRLKLTTTRPQKISSTKNVGSRVYCRFTNGAYYWGHIVQKRFATTGIHYAVQFDDGDFLDGIADSEDDAIEGNIYTELGYYKSLGIVPPNESSRNTLGNGPLYKRATRESYTAAELYRKRCKTCIMCTKKDCLRCTSCRNNKKGTLKSSQCCLQKVSFGWYTLPEGILILSLSCAHC